MPPKQQKSRATRLVVDSTDQGVIAVKDWAKSNNIAALCIEGILKDGFTTLSACELIESEDLGPEIPRGQQKVILRAVDVLKSSTQGLQQQNGVRRESAGTTQTPQAAAPVAGGSQIHDDYLTGLRDVLLTPQTHEAGPHIAAPTLAGIQQQSWADPQLYINMASGAGQGKTKVLYITDYVDSGSCTYDSVITTREDGHLVLQSQSRKPRLESLSLPQWSVANLAILNVLIQEGSLSKSGIVDYLSYTTKVYQLLKMFDQQSVYLYDKQYREHQARFQFRWGTDVGHLQTVHLQPRRSVPHNQASRGPSAPPAPQRTTQQYNKEGRIICRCFNNPQGCDFQTCKFAHTCNVKDCNGSHSATQHPKN
eukprot:GHVU01095968.1.p1 GENE.GHVU01095968.1~~GHVU01095968.1.p1  ORF type:complete len:366 (-),score=14.65 GHVU01095968.1:45-1142(-)